MKILVLGGTRFLGRHFVEAANASGHELTLFHRGRTNPELFPDIERLHGDRDGGLDALAGRRWDAVVDTCGYVPRVVDASAALLADSVERYLFISSISVYAGETPEPDGPDEDAELARIDDPETEDVDGRTYGALKVLCEEAVQARFGPRALLVRPGLIVGPQDPTDRYTYWPARVARGGPFLAPEGPELPVQHIDARDLAAFLVRLLEQGAAGPYNATAPAGRQRLGALLDASARAAAELGAAAEAAAAEPVWAPADWLLAREVAPWSDLPLWVPAEGRGFLFTDVSRAEAAGLTIRPEAETARDTLAWHLAREQDGELRAGLSPEREAELLAELASHRPM